MAAASDRAGSAKGFVLDCSVALAWCFPDERSPGPAAVLGSLASRQALVPALWPYEIANALLAGERRRRATSDDTAHWLRFLSQLPIVVTEGPAVPLLPDLLALAKRHGLSAYDAAYLDLAQRLSVPLATLDRRLQAAAKAAGVALFVA